MDDWNGSNEFEEGASGQSPGTGSSNTGIVRGGWHWLMTLVCLFTVTALSFLMAWLTKDTTNRPFWMIGAIFTVPTLGMFAAAMLVEQKTSAMTPTTSRKSQYLVALIAIVSTFAVGCIFDVLYQHGVMELVIRNWADDNPPQKVYSDIVLLVDKSSSLGENNKDAENRKAIQEWLDGMDDYARIGLITFSDGVIQKVPVGKLSNNRRSIDNALNHSTGGATNFDVSLYHAFRMIDSAEDGRDPDRTTQIIAITDAEAELPQKAMEAYAQLGREKNVAFYIVHLGQKVPASNPLMKLANATGGTGTSVGVAELSQYFEEIQVVQEPDWNEYYSDLRNKIDFDLIRVSDPAANLICGLMLGLEGLAIGLCLMIMLSVTGQKRIQPLISVLMAGAAFVFLKVIGPGVGPVKEIARLEFPQWQLEGISFSLLGIVFMTKNRFRRKDNGSGSGPSASWENGFDDFGGDGSVTASNGGFDDSF